MTEETFNGTWLEATTRRTFYLHMIDMPPVELQGLISLQYLIARINQLEKSGLPRQAIPVSGTNWLEGAKKRYPTRFPGFQGPKLKWGDQTEKKKKEG